MNNPVKYNDPTGHASVLANCDYKGRCADTDTNGLDWNDLYTLSGEDYGDGEEEQVKQAVQDVAQALADELNKDGKKFYTPYEAWLKAFGGSVEFFRQGDGDWGGDFDRGHLDKTGNLRINLYTYSLVGQSNIYWMQNIRMIIHELGHAFDYANGLDPSGDVPDNFLRPLRDGRIRHQNAAEDFYGYAGGSASSEAWQFGYILGDRHREEFADMFVGWVYGNTFNPSVRSLGPARAAHMSTHMAGYIIP